MKRQRHSFISLRLFALICGIILTMGAFAQQLTVKGHVKDNTGEPIIGATIRVVGQEGGTVSDFDGNFTLKTTEGSKLSISYIGYQTYEATAGPNMIVTLEDNAAKSLNEVVVIGYGVVKKSDLTGSVSALRPDNKNKGLVVNPQDVIAGKIAGVNITSSGGTPGAGATIRIRGGSSLNATNDPLIVIDGVAMDNNGVKGLSNPLSMVNPQDIESFNVLKDASATAIYGSRGSNGVIIITTKKGRRGQAPQVSYSGNVTVSTKRKTIDVMTGDEMRDFIAKQYGTNSDVYKGLGTANTNWQDEIYRTALSHDHNVTVSGSTVWLPYRVSIGYTNQQGIIKTSDFERYTAAVNLNPSFFKEHLNINLNAKGMWAKNHYAKTDELVKNAIYMDPTQSIYDYTSTDARNFNNYFQWRSTTNYNDPTWPTTKNGNATSNPLSLLYGRNNQAISRAFIGSADIDYKVNGFEDLRLHATLGADIAKGTQTNEVQPWSPEAMYYGSQGYETALKRNLSLSAYAQYFHDFKDEARNHFDIMAGYEWQHYWRKETSRYYGVYPGTNTVSPGTIYEYSGDKKNGTDYDGDGIVDPYRYLTEHYLVSFFGRANWSLMDRYYVTFTLRNDGSSRFKEHWAWFPSFAFAWRMKDENKFKEIKWLSDLKLRLGYGKTGQQDGTGDANSIGDYNYFPTYTPSNGAGGYYPIVGNGLLYRPDVYNTNLKWETTTTYNIGLDWGIFEQRLSGSIDWYYRKTTDLINTVYVPAQTTFSNQVTSNVGSLRNSGLEASLSWHAIQSKDWNWTIDYNFTYNSNKILELIGGDNGYYIATGSITSGTGMNVQAHTVGRPMSSFYVYQQVYDSNGKPIEGAYVDRDGDGQITPNDRYFYKSPNAPVVMGMASRLEYKNWDFGFSMRASLGNYVYNDIYAGGSNVNFNSLWNSYKYASNRPTAVLNDNWQSLDNILSDYFVRNASFLKVDNITFGYSFDRLFKTGKWRGLSGRIYGTASNVFTFTKYDGLDPEVYGGIDKEVYPRPISFILGVNLNF